MGPATWGAKMISWPMTKIDTAKMMTQVRVNCTPEPSKASSLAKIVPKMMTTVAMMVMMSCPH